MPTKTEYIHALKETHRKFNKFLGTIPESNYSLPSDNTAWTIGEVLHHITLGPQIVGVEIKLMINRPRLFQFFMRYFPLGLINLINAFYARKQAKPTNKEEMRKAYHLSHLSLLNELRSVKEEDLQKTIVFPALEPTITGTVGCWFSGNCWFSGSWLRGGCVPGGGPICAMPGATRAAPNTTRSAPRDVACDQFMDLQSA